MTKYLSQVVARGFTQCHPLPQITQESQNLLSHIAQVAQAAILFIVQPWSFRVLSCSGPQSKLSTFQKQLTNLAQKYSQMQSLLNFQNPKRSSKFTFFFVVTGAMSICSLEGILGMLLVTESLKTLLMC